MPVTRAQAYTIGHVAHAVREWLREDRADLPDWHVEGIVKNIERIANRRFPDVALAAIRAAMDPGAKTPGVIPTDGPHWSEGVAYDPPRIPKQHEECPLHAGNWRDACHGCAADQKSDTQLLRPSAPATAEQRAEHAEAARAMLRGEGATLTETGTVDENRHGVDPGSTETLKGRERGAEGFTQGPNAL